MPAAASQEIEKRRRGALRAFSRALAREVHSLSDCPHLLWQQLHNRLQSDRGSVEERLGPQREARSATGAAVWVRTRTPLPESTALVRTLTGHDGPVSACAFSLDGNRIASGGEDGTVRLWDPQSGTELRTLEGHTNRVSACAFSPDGGFLVSASWDGNLIVWDPASGQRRHTLSGHGEEVSDCAVAPDASYVVSASWDDSLKLWDPATGAELATLEGHGDDVSCCAVSPDGGFILSSSWLPHDADSREGARLWDPRSGTWPDSVRDGSGKLASPKRRRWRRKGRVGWCAVSPDATLVLLAVGNGVTICDPATRGELRTIECATAFAISPDGEFFVAAPPYYRASRWAFMPDEFLAPQRSAEVRAWDIATREELFTLQGHGKEVRCCAISPDCSTLVSGGEDATLKIWDLSAAEPRRGAVPHAGEITACVFSHDGTALLSASRDGTVSRWEYETGERLDAIGGLEDAINDCAISRDDSLIVAAVDDFAGTTGVWWLGDDPRAETLKPEKRRIELPHGSSYGSPVQATACAVSAEGSLIFTAFWNGVLTKWDAATAKELRSFFPATLEASIQAIEIAPDDSFLAASGGSEGVTLWDPAALERLRSLGPESAGSFTVTPDGRFIVTFRDGVLSEWDSGSGELVRTSDISPLRLAAVGAVSPDQRSFAFLALDGSVTVLDARGELALFKPPAAATGVAFHPWTPGLACGDRVGNVYLLDLVGVEYGPLVVTAIRRDGGLHLRCPACRTGIRIEESVLGKTGRCPHESCRIPLRFNRTAAEPLFGGGQVKG